MRTKNHSKRTLKKTKINAKSMKDIKMMPFEKNEVQEILEIVGAKTNENGDITYNDKIVLCEGCGTSIKPNNLGSVIPNSEHFICDNPLCFYKFYNKFESQKVD